MKVLIFRGEYTSLIDLSYERKGVSLLGAGLAVLVQPHVACLTKGCHIMNPYMVLWAVESLYSQVTSPFIESGDW